MQFLKRSPAAGRRHWLSIIGTLVVLPMMLNLSGCSATRLAYNNAPSLAFWWLDAYFDFDSSQALRMRNDLQALQTWHRQEELPLVAAELAALKARARQDTTPEQTCKLAADAQARATAPLQRLVPTLAALAPSLSDAQMLHIERELAKRAIKWREKYLDGTVEDRLDARLKSTRERTEDFYGRLSPAQIGRLRTQIQASSYDAALQYRETLRRHQDALQVLQTIRKTPLAPAAAQAALTGLFERSISSPDPAYRQYQARILQQSCATMTELHNSMNTEQRNKLHESLQGYENDILALLAQRQTGQTTP